MALSIHLDGIAIDLADRGIHNLRVKRSKFGATEIHFTEWTPENNPTWDYEATVEVFEDTYRVAYGKVSERLPQGNKIDYVALGPRYLSSRFNVRHPVTKFSRLVFNAERADSEYANTITNPYRVPATNTWNIGEIIRWLFDRHLHELYAERAIEVKPPPSSSSSSSSSVPPGTCPTHPYYASELAGLDYEPPKVVLLELDFQEAIERLLEFAPAVRTWVEVEPCIRWRFLEVDDLAAKTLTLNKNSGPEIVLSKSLAVSVRDRATAVKVMGPPKPVTEVMYLTAGDIEEYWDTSKETDWTIEKAQDTVTGEGDTNDYYWVYRRYRIVDEAKRSLLRNFQPGIWIPGMPGLADVASGDIDFPGQVLLTVHRPACSAQFTINGFPSWFRIYGRWDYLNGVFFAREPIVIGGLHRPFAARTKPDEVMFAVAYEDVPASVRYPSTGWAGTAYTQFDVQRELILADPDMNDDSGDTGTNWTKLATRIHDSVSRTVFAGGLVLKGIDPATVYLEHKINITGRDDDYSVIATGWEAANADCTEYEFDYDQQTTTLQLNSDQADAVLGGMETLKDQLADKYQAGQSRPLHIDTTPTRTRVS